MGNIFQQKLRVHLNTSFITCSFSSSSVATPHSIEVSQEGCSGSSPCFIFSSKVSKPRASTEPFFAFLGGYSDAEGGIGIYNKMAQFRLASYDRNILHQAHAALTRLGIRCPQPRIAVPKGYIDKQGHRCKQDCWSLSVYRKASLLLLFERMGPYLRHAKRIRDMEAAIRNIEERNARYGRNSQSLKKWLRRKLF